MEVYGIGYTRCSGDRVTGSEESEALQQFVHVDNFMHVCISRPIHIRRSSFHLNRFEIPPERHTASTCDFDFMHCISTTVPATILPRSVIHSNIQTVPICYISHSICYRSVYWHSVAIVSFILYAIFILLEIFQ